MGLHSLRRTYATGKECIDVKTQQPVSYIGKVFCKSNKCLQRWIDMKLTSRTYKNSALAINTII